MLSSLGCSRAFVYRTDEVCGIIAEIGIDSIYLRVVNRVHREYVEHYPHVAVYTTVCCLSQLPHCVHHSGCSGVRTRRRYVNGVAVYT